METSLMVDDYPTAPEEKTQKVKGTITITYTFEEEVPDELMGSELEEFLKENHNDLKLEEEEIEIEFE